jgi:hypothetical protein
MHNGNNNVPLPRHPPLKASLDGIEDRLAVAGRLEQEDVEWHRTVLKLPDPSEMDPAQPK